jgi:hypothetical protein
METRRRADDRPLTLLSLWRRPIVEMAVGPCGAFPLETNMVAVPGVAAERLEKRERAPLHPGVRR